MSGKAVGTPKKPTPAQLAYRARHARELEQRRVEKAAQREADRDAKRRERDRERDQAKKRAFSEIAEDQERYIEAARRFIGLEPVEGLVQMTAKVLALYDVTLAVGDAKSLVAAARLLADLSGYGRTFDAGDGAQLTPQERAERALRDSVHGPIIRQLVIDELRRGGGTA